VEQKQLTPQESLSLLDNATMTLKLDRNEHAMVIHALQVLQKVVNDLEETKKSKGKE